MCSDYIHRYSNQCMYVNSNYVEEIKKSIGSKITLPRWQEHLELTKKEFLSIVYMNFSYAKSLRKEIF